VFGFFPECRSVSLRNQRSASPESQYRHGKFDPSLPPAFRAARLSAVRIEEIFHDEDRRSLATRL
jgi:hypothetical protein